MSDLTFFLLMFRMSKLLTCVYAANNFVVLRLEVLIHVSTKDANFCGVTPCGMSKNYRRRKILPLSLGLQQKTDLAGPSETSANASRLQYVTLQKTTIFDLVFVVF